MRLNLLSRDAQLLFADAIQYFSNVGPFFDKFIESTIYLKSLGKLECKCILEKRIGDDGYLKRLRVLLVDYEVCFMDFRLLGNNIVEASLAITGWQKLSVDMCLELNDALAIMMGRNNLDKIPSSAQQLRQTMFETMWNHSNGYTEYTAPVSHIACKSDNLMPLDEGDWCDVLELIARARKRGD